MKSGTGISEVVQALMSGIGIHDVVQAYKCGPFLW